VKGKGLGMLIGIGSKGSDADEPSEDEGSDVLAAKALMKALKGSDAGAVVSAFREMSEACKGYDDKAEDSDDDEE
jgi:hypothetical protein